MWWNNKKEKYLKELEKMANQYMGEKARIAARLGMIDFTACSGILPTVSQIVEKAVSLPEIERMKYLNDSV